MLALIVLGVSAAAAQASAPPLIPAPPGETGARVEHHADGTVCVIETKANGEEIESCRSSAGDYERPRTRVSGQTLPSGPVREPLPVPRPLAPVPTAREPAPDNGIRLDPGSRWGFAGALAGMLNVPSDAASGVTGSGVFGLGFRYGLLERAADRRMWMPGLALLVGATVGPDQAAPSVEVRGEIMSVSPGGALQPNFVTYVSSGVAYELAGPRLVHPYAGLGIGWNWHPEGSSGTGSSGGSWLSGWGGGGGAGYALLAVVAVAVAAVAVVGFVFAGRIEVRYTLSPDPARAPPFASVVLGIGA